MKVIVDEGTCIGCTLCVQSCPELFVMESDKAKVLMDVVPKDMEECGRKAAEECPVNAILIKA